MAVWKSNAIMFYILQIVSVAALEDWMDGRHLSRAQTSMQMNNPTLFVSTTCLSASEDTQTIFTHDTLPGRERQNRQQNDTEQTNGERNSYQISASTLTLTLSLTVS